MVVVEIVKYHLMIAIIIGFLNLKKKVLLLPSLMVQVGLEVN
jgi:hypothetical protein